MATIFSVLGEIFIDNAKADQAIEGTTKNAGKAADGVKKVGDEGGKTESKLAKAFSAVGSAAVAAGKVVATGLAVGATAMAGLTIKSMNLVGELEQNMGGSEAVFKEHAEGMQKTAKEAYSNMGLSTSDFLATANKMGALFQGSGFTIKESSELSSKAMQRASDVASIMGIETTDAMEAIAGAAKGNFTMMDNLGVAMNDTAIKAYAMEKGIKTASKEMTQQEKIAIAMEMFLDKTSYAAGNYAKENDTLAGSLGTAKGALTNFLDGSGDVDGLIKSVSNYIDVVIKNLDELLPRLTSGITEIVQKIIPLIPPLLDKLLPPIIKAAESLINGLITALPGLIDTLVAVLPNLINAFVNLFVMLAQNMAQIIAPIVAALPTIIPVIIDGVVQIILAIAEALPEIIQLIIDVLPNIIISLIDALMNNLPMLITGLVDLIIAIVQAIPIIIMALIEALPTIIKSILEGLMQALPQLISGLVTLVLEIVKALPQILKAIFIELPKRMIEIVSGIFPGLKDSVLGGFKSVFSVLDPIITNVKNIFSGIIDFVKNVFTGNWKSAWEGVKKIFSNIVDGLGNIFKAPLNFIIDGVNIFIRGLNKLKIPDWVPGVGGKGINITELKKLNIGMEYVPYDDMPALLHRGEAVLTASEAKDWRRGSSGGVVINIHNPNFTNEREIDRIMNEVVSRLRLAGVKT